MNNNTLILRKMNNYLKCKYRLLNEIIFVLTDRTVCGQWHLADNGLH